MELIWIAQKADAHCLPRKASLPSKSLALKSEVLIIQRKILETVSGDYLIPEADALPLE